MDKKDFDSLEDFFSKHSQPNTDEDLSKFTKVGNLFDDLKNNPSGFIPTIQEEQFEADSIQDREERKKYAFCTFILVCSYLLVVLVITIFSGIKINNSSNLLNISDTVLITLQGTALAQIIGLFAFVMKYLFNTKLFSTKSRD
jgi:type IV secretory pathway component VirB8